MDATCPICGAAVDTGRANKARPFCSARCQYVDLARWLDEDYAIPGEPAASDQPEEPRGPSPDSEG